MLQNEDRSTAHSFVILNIAVMRRLVSDQFEDHLVDPCV